MLAPTGADVGAAIGRPLRKENSTPKRAVSFGAGYGNRTRDRGLGSDYFTIKLILRLSVL